MIKLLTRIFLKDVSKSDVTELRTRTSVLAGVLGIICNLVLFIIKLLVGMAMSSIAIISDAFNNLSDTGTSVVSIIGAKLSAKRPDREHPFGHGRMEYVFSLIVSFIIILVGFELLKTSVTKLFRPGEVALSPLLTIILCISVPIKLWMYSYNKYLGKGINSRVLLAAARDSVNDAIATSAVIISTVFGKLFNLQWLDGAVGVVVSLVIMYSGLKISFDTIGILLGVAPEKEIIEGIRACILNTPGIFGVHDLIVHDYGPGRCLASVHAEVPEDCDVVEIHEVIDALEQRIEAELGIHIVIHMDPVSVSCEKTVRARELVNGIVKDIDERLRIHDFRITDGLNVTNLIFDIEVPSDFNDIDGMKAQLTEKISALDERYNAIINVDFMYD